MRFWDSSALVPLVVEQPQSKQVESWLTADPQVVIWTLTPVEVASAVHRLVRDGGITEEKAWQAERLLEAVVKPMHVVADVEQVKAQAMRLLRLHPLRAADALQLGAALLWSVGSPAAATLHTFDGRLASAARKEGLSVE